MSDSSGSQARYPGYDDSFAARVCVRTVALFGNLEGVGHLRVRGATRRPLVMGSLGRCSAPGLGYQ